MTNNHAASPERPPEAKRDPCHEDRVGAAADARAPAELRLHPEAWRVREPNDAEFEAIRADIEERGVLTPLQVNGQGIVLDGRARLKAALELEFSSVPVQLVSPADEVEHMARQALARRHLSAWERAEIVLGLAERNPALAERGEQRSSAEDESVATLPPREKTRDRYARIANASPRTVQNVKLVKETDPTLLEQVRRGEIKFRLAVRRALQEKRRREAGTAPPLPDGCFGLALADPPWQSRYLDSDWAPENHYPTLPLEAICAMGGMLPLADDAVLFLWAVNALLREALEVMEAWGFEYRTNLCWVKPSIGLGTWVRCRHELLLVGTRGKIAPPEPEHRPDSVIEAARGRHSEKPTSIYELIERAYPELPKLELFARGKPRPGWTAWGNEVEQ